MFDRFNEDSRRIMGLARQESRRLGHDYIGTEHVLLGLLLAGDGLGARILQDLGLAPDDVRAEVEARLRTGTSTPAKGQLPFTPRAKRALELTLEEATHLGHTYLGSEHLLLGLLRVKEGTAGSTLAKLGVDARAAREAVRERRPVPPTWDGA